MIEVSLNSELVALEPDTSLSDALAHWGYSANPEEQKLAVALNGEFVPRSRYGNTRLKHHDLLDIVQPVGGG